MSERDKRWERVRGGMTPWRLPGDIEPTASRIDIEVVGATGHVIGQTIILTNDVRRMAIVDPLPYVLDKMVRKLDEALHA